MSGETTSAEEPRASRAAAPRNPDPTRPVAWAGTALIVTAVIGAVAKVFGVMVAPGMRGIAAQDRMVAIELVSATLGYTFSALLVALIGAGAYQLARSHKVALLPRGAVVSISGLVVALVLPAIAQRLNPPAAVALAVLTSVVAMMAATVTIRVAHTRIVGAVLGMLAVAGLLRPLAYQVTTMAGERASLSLYNTGRTLAASAVVVQALATLLAAAWLGTRSRVRGRLLANGAIVVAFGITYLAAHDSGDTPSWLEAMLRSSLAQAAGLPLPYGLTSIAAFLVPATVLLALVAVVQHAVPPVVLGVLALALLSHGAFDVPIQALALAAAAQWALLAMADDRTMWSALVRAREREKAESAS